MIIPQRTRLYRRSVCAIFSACVAESALAACNNPHDWLAAPGPEIKVFIGYEQIEQNNLDGETEGHDPAYAIPLPETMLSKAGTGRLDGESARPISYYEPDGKGNYRVCRIENWWPPGFGFPNLRAKLDGANRRYIPQNATLVGLPAGSVASKATLYYYDEKGRIEHVAEASFFESDQPAIDKICRRYDDRDRVTLAIAPHITKVCPKADPDIRDGWRRYRYGEYKGVSVLLLAVGHLGALDGSWSEVFRPFHLGPNPDDPWGNAEVDSKNGVTAIIGSTLGKRDDNAANTVVNSFGNWEGATYTFTRPPVPAEVLDNPDLIYKYERRRQTYVGGSKMFEFFPADKNVSRHRYYMLDGFVLRHEQLDPKGKVVRVITIEDWRQPRPGPKPDVDDKLLGTHHLALLAHQVFHRVYDIDASGKPVLVAVSWNRANRLIKGKMPIDYADLVYGTPDGKERWKTEADFEKAFNTSAHAAHVFPEEQKKKP